MNELSRSAALIRKYLDQDASPTELEELQQQIRLDPKAAERFAEMCRLECWIAQALQEEKNIGVETERLTTLLATTPTAQAKRTAPRRFARALLLMAASILLLATFYFWPRSRPIVVEDPILAEKPPSFQVVTGEVVVNGQSTKNPRHGDLVQVVGSQSARLKLSDVSRTDLEPKAQMVFHGEAAEKTQVLELIEGKGTFHVDPGQDTLQVETEVGRVTATGTSFGVQLLPRRNPEEAVFAGTTIARLVILVHSGIVQVDIDGKNYVLSGPDEQVFRADPKVSLRRREIVARVESADLGLVVLEQGRLRKKLQAPVNPGLKITIDGKPALAPDLVKGMTAYVQRPNGSEQIVGLRIEGPTLMGVLQAIDEKARTITLTIPKGPDAGSYEKVLPLHSEVKVALKGVEATLGDLVTGTSVVVKLAAVGQRALLISTPGSRREEQRK